MDSLAEKLVMTNDTEILVSDNLDLCVSESPATVGFGRQISIDETNMTKSNIITRDNRNEEFRDSIVLPFEDICNDLDHCVLNGNNTGKRQKDYPWWRHQMETFSA